MLVLTDAAISYLLLHTCGHSPIWSGGGGGVSDDDFTYGVSTVGGGKGGVFQHRHEA